MTTYILYIEDDSLNVDLMRRIVEQRPSAQLAVASTGAVGIATARQERPSLILLDHGLPDMTGVEVLAALRADPDLARTFVVILTGDTRVDAAFVASADAVLYKPIRVTDVLGHVDAAIGAA